MDEDQRIELHAWISGMTGQPRAAVRMMLDEGYSFTIDLEHEEGFWSRP